MLETMMKMIIWSSASNLSSHSMTLPIHRHTIPIIPPFTETNPFQGPGSIEFDDQIHSIFLDIPY